MVDITEFVVLVDENDREIGTEEKMKAHEDGGKLHRAFSMFIFSPNGKILLQQRAKSKYHCGGLWTNSCCSHPRPDEPIDSAAHRRLKEEMGFDCKLREILSFTYKAPFENGLTEWEFDHVFVGIYDDKITPDPEEVEDYKYIEIDDLTKDIKDNPDKYTPWFRIILKNVIENEGVADELRNLGK